MPSSKTIKFLDNHRQFQQSAGALIATLGHLPSRKQINFLTNHRQFDSQIADYIKKFHQLPDRKHMKVIIDSVQAEHNLERARQHVAHLQTNLHQISRLRPDVKVNTSLFDRNIAKAQSKVKALDKTVTTPHSKNYNIVWHPTIAAAQTQAGTLGAQLDAGVAAGITANTVLLNSAMTAAVNNAINAGRTAAQAKSPSRKAKKLIGDPILQGILAGLKDKKSIQDAANQAVSTMIDAFNSNRSTFQDQLGQLFAGATSISAQQLGSPLQQKIDWGEKLNIKDLQTDLHSQIKTFSQFQHGINELTKRRHVNLAFVETLRQQGPAAQGELDALLSATPKQLRRYEQMWAHSQRLINKTATTATKNQVKIWRQQGAAVALGFLSGMQQHAPTMARYFKNLFLNLLNQVRRAHKSHSPSLVYMQEGLNVAQGFELGVAKGLHPLRMRLAPSPVGGLGHRRPLVASVTNNYYNNRTYNVYPQKQENLLSALRKHDYVTRHRP